MHQLRTLSAMHAADPKAMQRQLLDELGMLPRQDSAFGRLMAAAKAQADQRGEQWPEWARQYIA